MYERWWLVKVFKRKVKKSKNLKLLLLLDLGKVTFGQKKHLDILFYQ